MAMATVLPSHRGWTPRATAAAEVAESSARGMAVPLGAVRWAERSGVRTSLTRMVASACSVAAV